MKEYIEGDLPFGEGRGGTWNFIGAEERVKGGMGRVVVEEYKEEDIGGAFLQQINLSRK